MFIHLFWYRLKTIFKTKEISFWCFAFPLILGTFFYISFGNLLNGQEFEPVKVAVVFSGEENQKKEEGASELMAEPVLWFDYVLQAVGQGDNALLDAVRTDEREAEQLLESQEVEGIIYVDNQLRLKVTQSGINQTVLKMFLDQCLRQQDRIKERIQKFVYESGEDRHYSTVDLLSVISQMIGGQKEYTKTGTLSHGTISQMAQYFYALIAMTCLYGCFGGVQSVMQLQADNSALGARRSAAPIHKMKGILADFLATVTVQFMALVLLLVYLCGILRLEIGGNILLMLLTCLAGALVGVAGGFFFGTIVKGGEGVKVGVNLGISMLCCFASGLMISGMKALIEEKAPFLNRINPATRITECLYALNVFSDYERFVQNILALFMMAGLLCAGSYIVLRGCRYDHI